MRGSIYERELKRIFEADAKEMEKISRRCGYDTRANYLLLKKIPFVVLRAAGSFGIDLVAVRGEFSFPVEVKSSSQKTFLFTAQSGRAREQADEMERICRNSNLLPLYAYRLKDGSIDGDPWAIFTLDGLEFSEGRNRYLYNKIPKIERTASGNRVMYWEHGLLLNQFVKYLYFLLVK
ncbi:MAG: Holliday junction resolvase [Thermoplasmata archaeon]|nr:Holliday junction resolvase [Thermoplasmata archaeon]